MAAALTTPQRTPYLSEQQDPRILLAACFARVRNGAQRLQQRAILWLVHFVFSFRVWRLEGMIRNGR